MIEDDFKELGRFSDEKDVATYRVQELILETLEIVQVMTTDDPYRRLLQQV